MRKLTLILLLLSLSLPGIAHAQRQQNVRFQHVQIDLWPEFDQPGMLVIYRATLAPETDLPANLTLRIPASVGEPSAVAERPPEGQLINTAYEYQVLGEWAYVNFSANFPEVQLEYYDTGIVRDGNLRTFTFNWPGDYAADNVIMLVQQPIGASNISTLPRLTSITQDSRGTLYLQGEIGAVAEGETFSMTVTYEKQSDDLSANFLQLESSTPLTEETEGRMTVDSALPWAMGIMGLAVILLGGYWYWSTGRQSRRPSRKPVRAAQTSTARSRVLEPELHDPLPEEPTNFCHQCGKRTNPGDKFCRSCGTKLRA